MIMIMLYSLLSITSPSTFKQKELSPFGKWKIQDEVPSIIEIKENNGVLTGAVIDILDPNKRNSICKKCEGINKNKPVIGLEILSNFKKDNNDWLGGTILRPQNGKIYKAKLTVIENGTQLKLTIDTGLFPVHRTWYKVE